MKRLLRILRGSAIILSLLLFLFTLILWPRSYYVIDGIAHSRNGYDEQGLLIRRTRGISSSSGHFIITAGHFSSLLFPSVDARHAEGVHRFHEPCPSDSEPISKSPYLLWYRFGFGHARLDAKITFIDAWFMPFWFLTLFFSLLPTLWVIRFRRHRRRLSSRLCPACGYDLRAAPDRCPECGTLTSSSAPIAPPSSARDTG